MSAANKANCEWCARTAEVHEGRTCPDDALSDPKARSLPTWVKHLVTKLVEARKVPDTTTNGVHLTPHTFVMALMPDIELEDGDDPLEVARGLLAEAGAVVDMFEELGDVLNGGPVNVHSNPIVLAVRQLQILASAGIVSGGTPVQAETPEASVVFEAQRILTVLTQAPAGTVPCPLCNGACKVGGTPCFVCVLGDQPRGFVTLEASR